MKELLLYMAKSLVDNPDQVEVNEIDGDVTVLELRVAPEDMGKLIGRQGRIAKPVDARADDPEVEQHPVEDAEGRVEHPFPGEGRQHRRNDERQ